MLSGYPIYIVYNVYPVHIVCTVYVVFCSPRHSAIATTCDRDLHI